MKRVIMGLGIVALAASLAACSNATAAPATPGATSAGSSGEVVSIAAKDIAFVQTDVSVAAGTPFSVAFDNQDGAPHNIAIADPSGSKVFKGEIVSGQKVTYQVPALAAGKYTFICEVHPDMKGTITAQ